VVRSKQGARAWPRQQHPASACACAFASFHSRSCLAQCAVVACSLSMPSLACAHSCSKRTRARAHASLTCGSLAA
jgi:hypothetical protein